MKQSSNGKFYFKFYIYISRNKSNLFVLSGIISESFAVFLNGVML